MEEQIESLLKQMTLEEKAAMCAGADMWHSTGVPRLGIPPFKMTDGPNGARGEQMSGGTTSACFPAGICLAATWNTDLIRRVGAAIGEEVKSKSAHVLLGPTVNIHRSPLNGRNFECYSEDPYLSARMAVAYVKGVQSQGVGACIKHFVCNDSEFQRMSISSEVGERALREIYLPPFRAAVQEADVWSVMSAYNKLNGIYCSENYRTLTEILKREWGFAGAVISDWTGVYSTAGAANGGLDIEMPGPARWMGEKLLQAVRDGQVGEAVIDDKVRRLLGIVFRSGALEHPETPEQSIDKPEHRRLIRQAAGEGMVLLKNERKALPLDANQIKTLAVIGPNAAEARMMGGGSAHVNPHHVVSPLDGIKTRCGDRIEIRYAQGCTIYRQTPLLNPQWLAPAQGQEGAGLTAEFFNTTDLSGAPALTQVVTRTEAIWFGQFASQIDPQAFSVRWTGQLTAPETGVYTFSLASAGLSRLSMDGKQVIDNWTAQKPGSSFFSMGSQEVQVPMSLEAGQSHEICVEFVKSPQVPFGGLRLGCLPPEAGDMVEQAAALAAGCDAVLLFVGTGDEWESEGFDRTDMELPGHQVELIERVAAANPRTVVVLNTGSPVVMPWLGRVPAVVEAWFPGQECGDAIADVLFGDVNPSGRLPQTFPVRLEDNPAFINYPGENGRAVYGEGIWVGYRYYDRKKVEPLFPFGYGLSYTAFAYSDLSVDAPEHEAGEPVRVTVTVTNTGGRAGQEVVQLYVRDAVSSLMRPDKELKAFAKVSLAPEESRQVTFTLDQDALSFYDDAQKKWVTEPGEFHILIGSSSRDIRASTSFVLKAGSVSEASRP